MDSGLIVILVLIGILFYGISLYNRLIGLRNRVRNGFAQIDVQLTRRHDLIPALIEAVKGYMKHERETLEAVIAARNRAVSGLTAAAADPANGAAIGQLNGAYPELKASENMRDFQEQLTSTENKVAFARQAFNDAVMAYNNGIEMFPGSLVAGWFRFTPAQHLEIESESRREMPDVKF